MTTAVLGRTGVVAKKARDPHNTTVNVRMSDFTKNLIDVAASILGKSRSEFIIDSARQQAETVLLDQRLFMLDAEKFEAFEKALDNPPAPNEALKQMMRRKPLWET